MNFHVTTLWGINFNSMDGSKRHDEPATIRKVYKKEHTGILHHINEMLPMIGGVSDLDQEAGHRTVATNLEWYSHGDSTYRLTTSTLQILFML